MLKCIYTTSSCEVIALYNDPPGEHHRVLQAVVVTAPGVGREEVRQAVEEEYLLPHAADDNKVIIVGSDELIIISSDTMRPRPLVDFVLGKAAGLTAT